MLRSPSLRVTRETYEEIANSPTSYVRFADVHYPDAAMDELREEDDGLDVPARWLASDSVLIATFVLAITCTIIACTQIYQGLLCDIATPERNGLMPRCVVYANNSAYVDGGAPDVQVLTRNHIDESVRFQGGWPMTNSIMHLATALVLLVVIVLVRSMAPATGDSRYVFTFWTSLIWSCFVAIFLFLIVYDFLTLERWKAEACTSIQHDVLAWSSHRNALVSTDVAATLTDNAPTCLYWRFGMLLFLYVCILMLLLAYLALEPLQLLQTSADLGKSAEDIAMERQYAKMLEEDHPRSSSFRRL